MTSPEPVSCSPSFSSFIKASPSCARSAGRIGRAALRIICLRFVSRSSARWASSRSDGRNREVAAARVGAGPCPRPAFDPS
eukprot:scaffold16329_cov121-Isochrysis_galbana.AAC.6